MFLFSTIYIYLRQKNPDEIAVFCLLIVERPLIFVERPLVIVERPLIFVERLPVIVERPLVSASGLSTNGSMNPL